MKNYKLYEKKFIGASDVAALTLTGCKDGEGVVAQVLNFGEDGAYSAYIVDDDAIIGSHYSEVATFSNWLRVFDDDEKTADFSGSIIKVYRAASMGCIIQVIK